MKNLPRHFNAHPSWKIKRLINHQTAKEVDLWVSWVNELWITLLTHQAKIFVHFCRFSDTKATQSCSHFIPSSELLSCIHNVCWKHFLQTSCECSTSSSDSQLWLKICEKVHFFLVFNHCDIYELQSSLYELKIAGKNTASSAASNVI